MKEFFADTFYWIALTVPTETAHERAGEFTGSIVTDGLALYCARPDKGYSLIDCISLQTMRREGLSEALTNDKHFEQEGSGLCFDPEILGIF